MNDHIKSLILKATEASEIISAEEIQSLWSGYGQILRIRLQGCDKGSVIVKHVRMPHKKKHPRGWNTDFSHLRKVKSYKVETNWYQKYSQLCDTFCRIPECIDIKKSEDEVFMVIEDLNDSGFDSRLSTVSWTEIETCLSWLAHFHATFIHQTPEYLWEVGTYWHLNTRPDELKIMEDLQLKNAATHIDAKLNQAKYQTFVHGDAKLANFCFSKDGKKVAAVDFQYVGGGCGMKDVAYFVGSCLYEDECETLEDKILNSYFEALRKALKHYNKNINVDGLEKEWRELYPVAWTDFHRFLKGWSPDHWKINSYSERLASEVVQKLNQ
jgi:hypothetical protein